jgi:hypothetical protein
MANFWDKNTQDPNRDWGVAPWGDVTRNTARAPNFYPDVVQPAIDTARSIASNLTFYPDVVQPAKNTAAPHLQKTPAQLGKDILSYELGVWQPHKLPIPDIEAIPGQLKSYLANSYGSIPALKRTVAEHPFRIGMDAATAALIPDTGGEVLAARLAAAGFTKAAAVAHGISVAGKVAQLGNPIYAAGKAVGVAGRTGMALAKGSALDSTGNFTAAARAAIAKAYPNGEIGSTQLDNPVFKENLVRNFLKSGVNPASVRAAVSDHLGIPPSRTVATRTKPPPAAAEQVQSTVGTGKKAIADQAQHISGSTSTMPSTLATGPDPSALGKALGDTYVQSLDNVNRAYKTAYANPVALHDNFHDLLAFNINDALDKNHVTSAHFGALDNTKKAIDNLYSQVKTLGSQGNLTLPNIETSRSILGDAANASSGQDARALNAVKTAMDKTLEHTVGASVDPDAQKALADFKAARAANVSHQTNFVNQSNPTIANALKLFGDVKFDKSGAPIPFPAGAGSEAQDALTKGMFNGSGKVIPSAERTFNGVSDLLGTNADVLHNHVRQMMLSTKDDGLLAFKPGTLSNNLTTPLGSAVFPPDEANYLNILDAANTDLSSTPTTASSPRASLLTGVAPVVATGAGVGAAHMAGMGFAGDLIGAAAGASAGTVGKRIAGVLQNRAEAAGAPAAGSAFNPMIGAGDLVSSAGKATTVGHALSPPTAGAVSSTPDTPAEVPTPPDGTINWNTLTSSPTSPAPDDEGHATGGRITRATGGQVGATHEQLVNRLMIRAKQAKRATDNTTKPLLNAPDEAIVKALDLAQQAI